MLHDFLTANRTALIIRCRNKAAKRLAPPEHLAVEASDMGTATTIKQLQSSKKCLGGSFTEKCMNKFTVAIGTMAIVGMGAGVGVAADPMLEKEAKPTLGERLTNYTVKGTLMRIDGEYLWVKDTGGRDVRLHVDQSTKQEKVVAGDKIKAYVTTEGHMTTLQRK